MDAEDKAESRSVSMRRSLWDAVERHAATLHEDRSSWMRAQAIAGLAKANALPGDPLADLVETATELAREHGAQAVKAKLAELTAEATALAGGN